MNLVISRFRALFLVGKRSIISALSILVYVTVLVLLLKVITDTNMMP